MGDYVFFYVRYTPVCFLLFLPFFKKSCDCFELSQSFLAMVKANCAAVITSGGQ